MPGGFRNDDFVNMVAANMVGNAMFMGYASQEDLRKKIEFGGCGYQPFKHHGLGLCVVDVKSSKINPEDVAEKMLDQLALLVLNQQAGTDAAQYERASWNRIQQSSLADTIMGIDTVVAVFGGRGESIGMHAHYTGRGSVYSDEMTNIMQLQYEEAKAAALGLFQRDKATTLIVEPLDEEDIDTSGEKSSYVGASQGDSVMSGGDYYAKLSDEDIAKAYQSPDMSKLDEFYLANGVRVVLMPHSQAPIVQANLLVGGGSQFGPYGAHNFATSFSDWEEDDVLKIAGTKTYVSTGTEFGVGYRVPGGNLDGAFWFLREYVDGLRPDTAGKYMWMRDQRSGVKGSWHSQGWHSTRLTNEHMYGDHYVGHRRSYEDVKEWETWGQDEIRSYINARLHPENATLLVVGNLDVAEAKQLAMQYFSGWEGRSDVIKEDLKDLSAPPMPKGKKVLLFDSPKRTQTQTSQMCRLNYEGDGDQHAISVLSELVFTRVFSQLRIKEGLAYSPGGYAVNRDHYGIMAFSSLAVNTGVGRTLEFFNEAILEMESGDVDAGILNQAKLRKSRADGVTGQSTGQMMGKLTSVIANERDWSSMADMGKNYAAVSAETLKRLTTGCAENSIVTLVGPKDIIEPQLKEKGIEYEVVDWEAMGDEILAKYDPKGAKKKAKKKAKADAKKAKEEAKKKAAGDEPNSEEATEEPTGTPEEAEETTDAPEEAEETTDAPEEAEETPDAPDEAEESTSSEE
jgi:predicted Zn-dependent peptidase